MEPGTKISHYQIAAKLGQGGMGVVYRAWDQKLQRTVALKFLPSGEKANPHAARFHQEALAVSALNHPNIATIYDIDDGEGRPFLALEYLPGGTLESALDQLRTAGQQISVEQGLEWAIQLAEALAHAHAHGVIHRDIKTANVMFAESGALKLTDFGLAKMAEGAAVTQTGTVMGTPAAMAPEQARGQEADERSDVFSTGVVLYELFTGEKPFKGANAAAVLYQVVHEAAPPMSRFRPGAPIALEQIVSKALRKEPAERYQTAAGLASELRALRRELLTGSSSSSAAQETVVIAASGAIPEGHRWRRFCSRRGARVAALCMAIVALALVAWWAWPVAPTRLAILPFANVDGDAKDQVAAAGFRELLIGQLTSVERPGGLLVIAPSSEEAKAKEIETPEQAESRLGANLVMTANLVRGGQQPRLIVHLLEPRTSEERGSETVELSGGDWAGSATKVARLLKLGAAARLRLAWNSRHSSNPQAERLYVEGEGLLHNGNAEAAENAFRDTVKQDAEFALAWTGLADAQFARFQRSKDLGLLNQASTSAEQAVKLDWRFVNAHVTRAKILIAEGDPAAAKQEVETALQIEPSNADALQLLGTALQELNSFSEALAAYKRAIATRPDDAAGYYWLGYFYEEQNKPELLPEAERNYLAAIKLAPESYMAHYNLGAVYVKLERYQDAFREFEESLLIAPSLNGYLNLGVLYYYQGQYPKAAEKWRQAVEFNANSYVAHGDLAVAYRWIPNEASKAPEELRTAIDLLKKEIAAKSGDAQLHAQLAAYHTLIRNPEPWGPIAESDRKAARAEMEEALRLGSARVMVQFLAVGVYERLNERRKALKAVEQTVQTAPDLMFYILREPELESVRADPEFTKITARLGGGKR
jgi:tetratricopeptide (TPR) repeat protein/TolB-like protein